MYVVNLLSGWNWWVSRYKIYLRVLEGMESLSRLAILIFYQIFNITLIHTVEGAKVSPTSLENPALRAEGSHSESFLQSAVSSLQTKLIYEVFEAKIPFWLVGLDSGQRSRLCKTGRWYSCGEERTQSRKCAGQRMRALMRYQPPSVHNTLARRHMFQARILKQNSSCSFIFRKCWDKLRRSV